MDFLDKIWTSMVFLILWMMMIELDVLDVIKAQMIQIRVGRLSN